MKQLKHITKGLDAKVLPIIRFSRESGMSLADIAKELNDRGIPTPAAFRKKYKNRRQGEAPPEWKKDQVYRILQRHNID